MSVLNMDLPRKRIDELLVLYKQEPELRDVFVEGASDLVFIRWFLKSIGADKVGVYEINTVECDAAKVQETGLENNARGRLVTLANVLNDAKARATCVIDADFDHFEGTNLERDSLLVTDLACLEMYCFNEKTMFKYLSIYLRKPDIDVRRLLDNMTVTLNRLFIIRYVKKILFREIEYLTFERCCEYSDNTIRFDYKDYIKRYLNKANRSKEVGKFCAEMVRQEKKLHGELRRYMNGHDFVDLLSLITKTYCKEKCMAHPEVLWRTVFGCAELNDLKEEVHFQKLVRRVS